MPTNNGGKKKNKARTSAQYRGDEDKIKRETAAGTAGNGTRGETGVGRNVRVASPAPRGEEAEVVKGEPERPFKGWPAVTEGARAPGRLLDAWHASFSSALTISQLRSRPVAEVVPEARFPDDDREQITTTTDFPWRCLCHLIITGPDGDRGWVGTGWLASPRLVVTAGHCVYFHESAEGWAQQIEIYPARNGDSKPFSYVSTQLRSVSSWTQGADPLFDYGAIILPDSSPTGFFGYSSQTDAELSQTLVNVYGYPADKTTGTLWGTARKLVQVQSRKLIYNISTFGGQSGCPVFIKSGDDRLAVGIHNYGGVKTNSATRITDDVFDDIDAWKAEAS
jgi:glutamyl endopeptidase